MRRAIKLKMKEEFGFDPRLLGAKDKKPRKAAAAAARKKTEGGAGGSTLQLSLLGLLG